MPGIPGRKRLIRIGEGSGIADTCRGKCAQCWGACTHVTFGQEDLTMDIGIDDKTREKIAEGLGRLLADSYTLYIKTHGFH